MKIIVGLGNPEEEYFETRHNIGWMMCDALLKKFDGEEFKHDKKLNALTSEIKIGKDKILLVKPETFMNKSGLSIKPLITSVKKAQDLIVIHDDLDLPLGRFKIQFNRSSGGHKGVESIIKNIKTEAFTRIKVGISPSTASGKTKKPTGEKVLDFIVGKFKKPELDEVKKISKNVVQAVEMIVVEGKESAMGEFNQK
jgi:peptidyl-tRNA hydrolase, PTH1 family